MPLFVFTALVHLGLGWNGLGAVSNILGFGAGQAGGGGSTALSAKLGKACFFVYDFQSFAEACRYMSETCGECPRCRHPWLSMVYSKQFAGAQQISSMS